MPTPSYDPLGSMYRGTMAGVAVADAALRSQQLQSEAALRRLQEQQLAQNMALQLAQHNLMVQQQADTAKANAAFQMFTSPYLPGTEQPFVGPPEANGNTPTTVGTPNPLYTPNKGEAYLKAYAPLAKSPEQAGKLFMDAATINLHEAQAKRQEALAAEEAGGGFKPTAGSVTLPSGQSIPYVRTSKGQVQLAIDPSIEMVTDPSTGKQTPVLRTGLSSAKTIPADIGERQTRQKLLATALSIDPAQVDEDGNLKPEGWASIQKQAQITPAVRTQLEKQQAEATKVFSLGQDLADVLTPENVGIRGNLTRITEGLASQIIPGFKIGDATDAVTLAKEYNASLVRGLKSDSNIAEPERKSIQDSLPDPTEWTKGVQQAKSTLATSLAQWGKLSRQNALMLGKPITPAWLTPDEVMARLAKGDINREQAEALMHGNGWNLVSKLREQSLRNQRPLPFDTTSAPTLRR